VRLINIDENLTALYCQQDTWVKDQLLFDEDQLQNLSTMLVGTSYCMSVSLFPWGSISLTVVGVADA